MPQAIRVFKTKIVVFTRKWKTTLTLSYDEDMLVWTGTDGTTWRTYGPLGIKNSITDMVRYAADEIRRRHCDHIPQPNDAARCSRCGGYLH